MAIQKCWYCANFNTCIYTHGFNKIEGMVLKRYKILHCPNFKPEVKHNNNDNLPVTYKQISKILGISENAICRKAARNTLNKALKPHNLVFIRTENGKFIRKIKNPTKNN